MVTNKRAEEAEARANKLVADANKRDNNATFVLTKESKIDIHKLICLGLYVFKRTAPSVPRGATLDDSVAIRKWIGTTTIRSSPLAVNIAPVNQTINGSYAPTFEEEHRVRIHASRLAKLLGPNPLWEHCMCVCGGGSFCTCRPSQANIVVCS